MKNLFKSLIVWLMFVAIPFQGFAAASMLTCAPMQAPAAMAAGHCDQMKADQHHAAAASAGASDQTASQHHAGGKCNSCASCCFGAVMAPVNPVVRVPGETGAPANFAFQGIHVPVVDLDLPERPPKTSLT